MLHISYFRDKCIGCGVCVEIAPYRWRMSQKDGKSTLIRSIRKNTVYQLVVDTYEERDNKLAADNCPVKIIRIQHLKK